jgi:hypothetical protein
VPPLGLTPQLPTWAGDVSPALSIAGPPAKAIPTDKSGIKVIRVTAETTTQ